MDKVRQNNKWVLYSSKNSIRHRQPSMLAAIELIFSVGLYWWIAITWQTHLHLMITIVAAPLVLMRSEKSVEYAQELWDRFSFRNKELSPWSAQNLIILLVAVTATWLFTQLLAKYWPHEVGKSTSIVRKGVVAWISLNTLIAMAVTLSPDAIVAYSSRIAKRVRTPIFLSLFAILSGLGLFVGFLGRSILVRAISVARHPLAGARNISSNWQRIMLVEDVAHAPELLPGVTQRNEGFHFAHNFKRVVNGTLPEKIGGLFLVFVVFVPSLVWRYSLKSTSWFYAPLVLISTPGKFADPELRKLLIDRHPPAFEKLRLFLSSTALIVALFALVDWPVWNQWNQQTDIFNPIGWVLVLDWERFLNQPWQWFSFPSALLTITLYFWVDNIRKSRRRIEETKADPEVAFDHLFSTRYHPGLTIYRLHRVRTTLVVISILVGAWFFLKDSYLVGRLQQIDPILATIFGER